MQPDWAAENLQVIRTLMERSAIYRRALAPMTLLAGGLGTVAAIAGQALQLDAPRPFILYWLGVAVVAACGAAFLVRRQALQAGEAFWSPPARRVARAALPAATAAAIFTLGVLLAGWRWPGGPGADDTTARLMMPAVWIMLYGLALSAAGFFMPRGIQWLGWIFIAGGGGAWVAAGSGLGFAAAGHWLMGLHFGLLHLAYGCYLLFTEKPGPPL
jgi:hypothetical protein